jgi:hypothetical protein
MNENDNENENEEIYLSSPNGPIIPSVGPPIVGPPSIGPKNQFVTTAQKLNTMEQSGMTEVVVSNGKRQLYSAGVLPFYVKNKTIYFLVGKDYEGKWSDFGGRSEIQDSGRWDITASREFYEETIGSIMDIQTMSTRIQSPKITYRINSNTMSGSSYYMYLVKIPYKDTYRNNFHSTLTLLKYINQSTKNNDDNTKKKAIDYKYFEKHDIQWISMETLQLSLNVDITSKEEETSVNYPLRHIFKKTFEENSLQILEFCKPFYNSSVFDRVIDDSYDGLTDDVVKVDDVVNVTRANSYNPNRGHHNHYNTNFFSKGFKNTSNKWR